MALQPCTECGRKVSTLAFTCPDCGAPVEAPPGIGGPAAGLAPAVPPPAGLAGARKGLLLTGALAMALLGAVTDAALRHRTKPPAATSSPRPTAPEAAASNGRRPGPTVSGPSAAAARIGEMTQQLPGVGLPHRYAAQAIDSLRALRMDEAARNAEIDVRLTLADVASQQEIDDAADGSYTRTLKGLGVVPRPGVHVTVNVGGESWAASATLDRLPGMTCSTGGGVGQGQPGQVACERR